MAQVPEESAMTTDHSTKRYYETYEKDGDWHWKIYHYDKSGNKEIVMHRSTQGYDSSPEAEDACVEFMDANSIEADLS